MYKHMFVCVSGAHASCPGLARRGDALSDLVLGAGGVNADVSS